MKSPKSKSRKNQKQSQHKKNTLLSLIMKRIATIFLVISLLQHLIAVVDGEIKAASGDVLQQRNKKNGDADDDEHILLLQHLTSAVVAEKESSSNLRRFLQDDEDEDSDDEAEDEDDEESDGKFCIVLLKLCFPYYI